MIFQAVLIVFVIINLFSFYQMYKDKNYAREDKYRIPEANLLFWGLVGAGLGIGIGMWLNRHKINDMNFKIGIPISIIQNLCFLYFLYRFLA